jgi:molybdopterin-containing oxidoreductase family iron-sulfur binding subunit
MSTTNDTPLTLDALGERLRKTKGKQLWRSLDELADSPQFHELLAREFPRGAAEMADPLTRRNFLKLMGASLALAGVAGCTFQPREQWAPFAIMPEGYVPGVDRFFSSALTLNGYATGALVRSSDGRPTKVEGNPNHPASLGASDVFMQASLLQLYDPDRSQQVLRDGGPADYRAFVAELQSALTGQQASGGAGLRLLTTTITSPTLINQINALLAQYPNARWYQYEPINRDNVYSGAAIAFGEAVETRYDLAVARSIVALDADVLAPGPGFIPYARGFADGRRARQDSTAMNRLFVAEATPSTTGAAADAHLAIQAGRVETLARALATRLGIAGLGQAGELDEAATRWLEAAAEDLEANRGTGLVMVGDQQPAVVHAIAHALNAELGNVGSTVFYSDPVAGRSSSQISDLAQLMREMGAGSVQLLLMIGGNPAYNAPGDLAFAQRLQNVGLSVHLSLYNDETSRLSAWHIPAAHELESWTDARAYDGTISIVQPQVEPLYGGKTPHQLLSALLGAPDTSAYDLLRNSWQELSPQFNGEFEIFWQVALSQGYVVGSALPERSVSLVEGGIPTALPGPAPEGYELVFRPDDSLWDGSYANNGWLQELPRPLTKLTWDNAALVGARTFIQLLGLNFNADALSETDLERLSGYNGRMVRIDYRGGSITAPLWLMPGHAEGSISLQLGYGRPAAGQIGDNVGVNVYPIRTSDALWFGSGANVTATGASYQLVSTQNHWTLEHRDIVRTGNFAEFVENPKYIAEEVYREEYGNVGRPEYQSFFTGEHAYPKQAWGMNIDLTTCIGCNACVIACQAENNIPIVGKSEVARGREMHWIRIDRYFAGNIDNPSTFMMPMACMQCEQAPCEIVCPVAATVHDFEGLNNMVYNRCVGTKYCSNNCPYKVRRFNFLQYTDVDTIQFTLLRNPDVTVRNRGVMEKCTYCVQRISNARIEAKKAAVAAGSEEYVIEDGSIVTACEAACPTNAIVFGDLNDANSRVKKLKDEPHNFYPLGILNTKPRTTYLARIRNPHEALEVEGEG